MPIRAEQQQARATIERMMRIFGARVVEQPEVYKVAEIDKELRDYQDIVICSMLDTRYVSDSDESRIADPLSWWKEHCIGFPRLATLAKRFLCIACSSSHPCVAMSEYQDYVEEHLHKPYDTMLLRTFIACNRQTEKKKWWIQRGGRNCEHKGNRQSPP